MLRNDGMGRRRLGVNKKKTLEKNICWTVEKE